MTVVKANPARLERFKKTGILFISTGAFSGYFPVAPGTAGSLVGALIVWKLQNVSAALLFILSAALLFLGVWAGSKTAKILKQADPSKVVIDEIVGMMITMIGIPVTGFTLGLGFLLFRFLDVWKPFPANYFDKRLKNGWGIMLDDVVAGIYGNIILQLVMRAQI